MSVLQLICDQQEAPTNNSGNNNAVGSAADEIKKFKELLDDVILTQAEFDAKRKEELLGLCPPLPYPGLFIYANKIKEEFQWDF